MQDVILLTGAGQIGLAIARRMGHGKKIVVSDKNINNAQTVTKIMTEAGFDAVAVRSGYFLAQINFKYDSCSAEIW